MRILVTGAGGFVGSRLIPALMAEGYDVVGVVRERMPPELSLDSSPGKVSFVTGDLTQGLEIPGPIDVVIHAASTLSVGGRLPVADHIANNTMVTCDLIEKALSLGVRKFLFFSTVSVYGEINESVIDENTPTKNPDIYGLSKYLAEQALAEAASSLPSISLRLPGIIGKGAHQIWLPRCVGKMLRNEPVKIYNPSALFNNSVHISDICNFMARLLKSPLSGHEVITLGAGGALSIQDVMERLASGLGSHSEIIESRNGRSSYTISIEKAQNRFGYAPMDTETMIDHYAREILDAT